jgi:hypothetical protein
VILVLVTLGCINTSKTPDTWREVTGKIITDTCINTVRHQTLWIEVRGKIITMTQWLERSYKDLMIILTSRVWILLWDLGSGPSKETVSLSRDIFVSKLWKRLLPQHGRQLLCISLLYKIYEDKSINRILMRLKKEKKTTKIHYMKLFFEELIAWNRIYNKNNNFPDITIHVDSIKCLGVDWSRAP